MSLIVIWMFLGAGTSVAWFADTSDDVRNVFNFSKFDAEVSKRNENGSYTVIDGKSAVFDDNALYEPGYIQIVFLRVKNKGNVPFKLNTAVNIDNYVPAINVFGQQFNLQDYLKFGVVDDSLFDGLSQKLKQRDVVEKLATLPLNNYAFDTAVIKAGQEMHIALVVTMPKEVDNLANYRGSTAPRVELGVILNATQTE